MIECMLMLLAMKALVRRAGCVGSGPGFRLEDVHAALRGAVIDG